MASIFIGVNRGAATNPDNITEGAATGSTDVELRIDTSKNMTRQDVDIMTKRLLEYLKDGRVAVFPM